jgi:hypothetical protein
MAFQEYSPLFPHEEHTLGFAGGGISSPNAFRLSSFLLSSLTLSQAVLVALNSTSIQSTILVTMGQDRRYLSLSLSLSHTHTHYFIGQ